MPRTKTLAHRQALAVSVFETLRDRALAHPTITPVKRARLTFGGGHGATQAAMAAMAGVSLPTYLAAEAGRPVAARTRRKIARAFGCEVAELFLEARS